jgi:hypothetical protein
MSNVTGGNITPPTRSNPTRNTTPETVSFSEKLNKWTTFYSFFPEEYSWSNTGLISWFKGGLHLMFSSSVHNTFFNDQQVTVDSTAIELTNYSEIHAISNQGPMSPKVYRSLSINSNRPWSVIGVDNERGQDTSVSLKKFKKKEGIWYASFMKDINSKKGKVNGDDIRSKYLIMKLRNTESTPITMIAAGASFTPSSGMKG